MINTRPTNLPALIERAHQAEFITAFELAVLLRYEPNTVYRKIRRGQVPGVLRHGRTIRIHRLTALRAFLPRLHELRAVRFTP